MIWILEFRNQLHGGAVTSGSLLDGPPATPGATLDILAIQQRIVFLVHGFNVDREDGRAELSNFANALLAPPVNLPSGTAFVAINWPGDSSWLGPACYPFEGNNADDSGANLARFIETWIPAGTEIGFVTHSMGGRVAFETMKHLPVGSYRLGQVCTMAAAIDDFSLAEPVWYEPTTLACDRVVVLSSVRDSVLKWWYPIGDLVETFLFFWKNSSGLALGYHGPVNGEHTPVPANVLRAPIDADVGVDHGDYLFSAAPNAKQQRAVAFAGQVLRGDPRPQY